MQYQLKTLARAKHFKKPHTSETPYRADIDGLRAVAIIAVVLYHGFPTIVTGGFVGVDVFFVISGFLISANIFRQIDAGAFGFRDFYGRRIRRIFPALIVVLVACLSYGFVVLLPSELALLGKNVVGGAGFASNLLLWHEAGYFDQAAVYKPLLHLWSLGVEEQFYIVWPAALWLLARWRQACPIVLLLAWAVSLGVSIAIVGHHETVDFYAPFTRLWELDSGGLLAWLTLYTDLPAIVGRHGRSLARLRIADALSLLGLAAILCAVITFNRRLPFPGALALLPVVGGILLIAAGPSALVNRTLLTTRVAVFIGLISYPLYLWHWPLISFAYVIDRGRPLKIGLVVSLIAVSIALAWLTYRFIERPLRFGGQKRRNTVLLLGVMTAIGLAGVITWQARGFPGRYPPLPHLSIAKINAAIDNGIFKATPSMHVRKVSGITIARIGRGKRSVLFTGDSVVFQYGPRVQTLLGEGRLKKTVYFAVGPSCAPVPGVIRKGLFASCNHLVHVAKHVIADKHIKTIIFGAAWAGYAIPSIRITRHRQTVPMNTAAGITDFYANLKAEVARLERTGHDVYLVAAPVANPRFNPQRMVTRSAVGFTVDRNVLKGVAVSTLIKADSAVNGRLRAIARATGAKLLNPLRDVCGAGPRCSAFFDHGQPKYADSLHLRPGFVAHHVTMFDRLLDSKKDKQPMRFAGQAKRH